MLAACKNKDGESERTHSRPMAVGDMKKIYEHFLAHCPKIDPSKNKSEQKDAIATRGSHLLFNALASSAFTVWMRYV